MEQILELIYLGLITIAGVAAYKNRDALKVKALRTAP